METWQGWAAERREKGNNNQESRQPRVEWAAEAATHIPDEHRLLFTEAFQTLMRLLLVAMLFTCMSTHDLASACDLVSFRHSFACLELGLDGHAHGCCSCLRNSC